jgi:hypothetical protein
MLRKFNDESLEETHIYPLKLLKIWEEIFPRQETNCSKLLSKTKDL